MEEYDKHFSADDELFNYVQVTLFPYHELGDSSSDESNDTPSVRNWTSLSAPSLSVAEVIPTYSMTHVVASSIVVTAIMLVIVLGNVLVVVAVGRDRSLAGPQNWFIASLAVSDILVGLFIMPLSLANELMGYWAFGSVLCDAWLSTDVLMCSASILNLVLISLDRYWSITRAVEYVRFRTRRRAAAMIAVVWILSALICFPPLVGWKQPQPVREDGRPLCVLSEEPSYIVYSTVGSFYIPLVVMIAVYLKIFHVTRMRARRSLKKTLPKATAGVTPTLTTGAIIAAAPPAEMNGGKTLTATDTKGTEKSADKLKITEHELCTENAGTMPAEFTQQSTDVSGEKSVALPIQHSNTSLQHDVVMTLAHENVNTGHHLHDTADCNDDQQADDDEKVPSSADALLHQMKSTAPTLCKASSSSMVVSNQSSRRRRICRSVRGSSDVEDNEEDDEDDFDDDCSEVGSVRRRFRSLRKLRTTRFLARTNLAIIGQTIIGRGTGSGGGVGSGFGSRGSSRSGASADSGRSTRKDIVQATLNDPDHRKRRIARAKERRAFLVLGIVMASFIGCWLPFFSVYLVTSLAGPRLPALPKMLFAVFFWLGYCNSALNPIIYTIFNRDFRRAFQKILCGKSVIPRI